MLRQKGAVLIAILAVLGMAAVYLFVRQLSANQLKISRGQNTETALALAKDALIGRAVTDDNRPGSLPCPDLITNIPGKNVPGDGKADMLVGNHCPSYVGWLPWRTLGLPDLRDASGERLWYALSPSLRDDDSAQPINSSTTGDLTIGITSQIAAVVFAPGPPLPGQARPSNNVADYLDGSNSDGDGDYVAGPSSDSFNDRLIFISRDELFRAVAKRVLAVLRGVGTPAASGLRKYRADFGVFPWADTNGDLAQNPDQTVGTVPSSDLAFPAEGSPPEEKTRAWLENNAWPAAVSYKVEAGQSKITIELNGISTTCTLASCP